MEENSHFIQIISGSLPGPFFFFFLFFKFFNFYFFLHFLSIYLRNRNLSTVSAVMQDNRLSDSDRKIWSYDAHVSSNV